MTAPKQTFVLILTGAPGVGKTTTARILAARSDRAVHLESDLFFQFIQSGYIDPWKPESHEQNRIVMRDRRRRRRRLRGSRILHDHRRDHHS